MLYLHGGGYVFGSIFAYRSFLVRIARRLNMRVVAPAYRQAPEHPFPAALGDAEKAYAYCVDKENYGPLILGGDSAGGGLALALLLQLRNRKATLPRAAFFLSPFFDHTCSGNSWEENRPKEAWLTKGHIEVWSAMYRGVHPKEDPRISPLFSDLTGLCPLLLFAGENEVLLDDARIAAEKAKAAGVDATFSLGKKMQHDWPLTAPCLAESKAAMKQLADFVAKFSNAGSTRSERDASFVPDDSGVNEALPLGP